jgi:hypothetical protein
MRNPRFVSRILRRVGLAGLTTGVLLAGSVALAPQASATAVIEFSFDDCDWNLEGGFAGWGVAVTNAVETGGECRQAYGWIRYRTAVNGPTLTHSCFAANLHSADLRCAVFGFHVQSRARVQSWETFQWQDSGWRL